MVVVIEIEVVDWQPVFSGFFIASSKEEAATKLEDSTGTHYYECWLYAPSGEVIQHLRKTRIKRD